MTALTRVVNTDRMRLVIQRADKRRMPQTFKISFTRSKQAACCCQCGDLISIGDELVLNETTGRAWCVARCWTAKS